MSDDKVVEEDRLGVATIVMCVYERWLTGDDWHTIDLEGLLIDEGIVEFHSVLVSFHFLLCK